MSYKKATFESRHKQSRKAINFDLNFKTELNF